MRLVLLAAVICLCLASPGRAQSYADWYPQSISAPAGHQYPCALTALPRDLTGIPAADKQCINHIYSMLLKCAQSKLVMIDELLSDQGSFSTAFTKYQAETLAARKQILAEPTPATLQPFRSAVVSALDNQMAFFAKAVKARLTGASAKSVLQIPEARVASEKLMSAWSAMQSSYPSMSQQVSDSTYHHLCALDVF